VSESSETGQASIVFLGRESFRMQVVDAEAIPGRVWDTPTERIIERRRNSERRKPRQVALEAPVEAPVEPWPASGPTWKRIAVISLATFACGALVATGVDHMRRRAGAIQTAARGELSQTRTAAPATIPQPATPAVPAAVVEPLARLEPPAPAATPALVPPPSSPSSSSASLKLEPKRAPTPAIRPRRLAPARAARPAASDPFAPPATKPAGPRRWVDPFAE
jgi:hypothetical protein